MYTLKFAQYNNTMKEVMSEEGTLDNILTIWLENKPTAEDKKHLKNAEDWAKYAFDNDKNYYVTFFKGGEPIACVFNYFETISIDFLTYHNGELFIYLFMVYDKGKDSHNKDVDGKIFLRQIELYDEDADKRITNKVLFRDNGIMNVETITKTKRPEFRMNYEEKETQVNLSHNWLRKPQNYTDYEYLFDYQNILKPEYLDLP
jgi:hypothetical protein